MVASASCPVGRFVMAKLRLRSVGRFQYVAKVDWKVESNWEESEV